MYQPKHRRFNANIGFFFENFSENGAKSGSGVIYTLIYQNENGMSYMQGLKFLSIHTIKEVLNLAIDQH